TPHSPAQSSAVMTPPLKIPPGKHRVEFHYTGLNLSAPDQVRFRYRLSPLDRDWIECGVQRTASYGYVPHGQYRFEVSACNAEGGWNPAGAGLALAVSPLFWQSSWFIAMATLALLASVGGAVRIVEKRRHHRQFEQLERERAIERERARIAQDLHD